MSAVASEEKDELLPRDLVRRQQTLPWARGKMHQAR